MSDLVQPRRPGIAAFLIFLAAGLVLCWPMATGQFLAGPDSDQFVAGYGFRLFGAEYFRNHGSIPLWNPYLFGGLPFVGAMHGDIFYPTAWLRWIVPTDVGMNVGFAFHIVLAGTAMYALLRGLRVSWGGAVLGGISWELSGLVAGLVHPGHDGKLFVAALTPLVFLSILRVVRDGDGAHYGLLALLVGLVLHGHPQLSYYLLVAAGLWGGWLLFLSPDRPPTSKRVGIVAASMAAVAVGFGIYAIQALPFIEYMPYSPRAVPGSSSGWEYATAYSLPPSEIISVLLPEFNGLKAAYWGGNFLKHHTEYLGILTIVLAAIGVTVQERRKLIVALGAIGLLFFLIALGGHTPFYRLWYEVMPMMKKVRAPGMAFFLVAFPISIFAGFGADRVLTGGAPRKLMLSLIVFTGVIGLLGAVGVLQPIAEALSTPERLQAAMANAEGLRAGGGRVLLVTLLVGGALAAVVGQKVTRLAAVAVLVVVMIADLWSVEREFFVFSPPVSVSFGDDEITAAIRRAPEPYRVLDVGIYRGSWLMAHRIPAVLGYHGNEIRFFDELMGGKNVWSNLFAPTALWDLYAVRFLVVGQEISLPGWHQVLGPVATASGTTAYLYERDTPQPWGRLVAAAAKIPEGQIIPTLLDQRFGADRIVLFPDTASVAPDPLDGALPNASPGVVTLSFWEAGRMRFALQEPAQASYLLIGENWYPDWEATVDGDSVAPLRGQYAFLTVPVPAGAREVELVFRSKAYERGKVVSLLSLILAFGVIIVSRVRTGRRHGS